MNTTENYEYLMEKYALNETMLIYRAYHPEEVVMRIDQAGRFEMQFNSIVMQIISNCRVFNGDKSSGAKALWDTGAAQSGISLSLAKDLGLSPIDATTLKTITGTPEKHNIYNISLDIGNEIRVNDIKAVGFQANTTNFDMIIGMDVISQGVFQTTCEGGKTTFSFALM